MTDIKEYLIRKSGAWYRPNSAGYTNNIAEAGRYTLAEAEAITHPNGPNGPRDNMSYEPAPPSPAPAESGAVALTVIDEDDWEPCSPSYFDLGGRCNAPRVWNEWADFAEPEYEVQIARRALSEPDKDET